MSQENTIEVEVLEAQRGQRLDSALASLLPDLSRTRLKNLILAGAVNDGETALIKPQAKIVPGTLLTIEVPALTEPDPQPENIPLEILHEDDDVIVINKPAGLVVHPAPGNWTGTLVNALLYHCRDSLSGINGVKRPGIVHRLDKETSGVMVAAKNDKAHQDLAEQFAEHGRDGKLERGYLAFIWGRIRFGQMRVEAPIGRDPTSRLKMKVIASGRNAITHVQELEHFGTDRLTISKVAAQLETGRTHQIRVHLTSIGNPVLADDVYGAGFKSKVKLLSEDLQALLQQLEGRQALHAAKLAFVHPSTGEKIYFETPLPAELQALEQALNDTRS